VSVLAPPAPAPAVPAPSPAPAAKRTTRRLLFLGIALIVLLLGGVTGIFASFGGAFSNFAVVEAQLPASSTAVALNAPVEYRNVTVGTVASEGRSVPGGLVLVTLHLNPSMLHEIPAGVEATETPVSFFGDNYLVLEPPARLTNATLQAGATIPALRVGQTASLQATLGDLDTLLLGLHPAELDSALTAVAGALQGEGTALGHNLDRGNAYFSQMLRLWPTVVSDLKLLVPVSDQFAASTKNILAILSNQTTTGATINDDASAVRQAIGGGADLASETTQLLTAIQQPYAILAADSGPFLSDISQNPTEISQLLSGLDAWAKAWTAAEASGPYLSLTANVVVANPADLGLAVLGGPEMVGYLSAGLGPGFVNPATYSSAGSIPASAASTHAKAAASVVASALARSLVSTPVPAMAASAETRAVSQIVGAMSGSRPASPAVAALLVSPLLSSLVSGR
jgi:phospholipid/cholesterol/gamma-HCH transport system substrate-binding protein